MSERPSGWYDDPENPAELLRYWDGILWSERTTPKLRPELERSTIGSPARPSESDNAPSGNAQANPWAPAQQQRAGVPQGSSSASAGGSRTPDGTRLSGWWRRVGALIIDNLLVFIISAAITWTWLHPWVTAYENWMNDVFDAARNGGTTPQMPAAVQNLPWQTLVANVVIYAVYEIGMIWRFAQTVGKKVAGIAVRPVGADRTPSLQESTLRFVIKQITVILQPLGAVVALFTIVDYLWPLWDKMKQALHDKAAKTYVVRRR